MENKKKDKIVVTGANGQLGSCLREISSFHPEFDYVFTDVKELDITDRNKVLDFFTEEKPTWIINAAAYTAVDKAESDEEKARLINFKAVEYLVEAAKSAGTGFVHISTDYVFPGTNPQPLDEYEHRDPLSVYGKTKMEGEDAALAYDRSIVLRTGWLYSEYGNNFVKTMLRIARDKKEVKVVSDQWGTPTSAHDLAKAVMTVIKEPVYGLYNFSNEGLASWALFAEEIFSQSKIDCKVLHISSDGYKSEARRPAFSILNKKKFSTTYKVDIPEWEAALEEVIHKLDSVL